MKKQKTGMEKQKTGMEKQEAEMEKQGQGKGHGTMKKIDKHIQKLAEIEKSKENSILKESTAFKERLNRQAETLAGQSREKHGRKYAAPLFRTYLPAAAAVLVLAAFPAKAAAEYALGRFGMETGEEKNGMQTTVYEIAPNASESGAEPENSGHGMEQKQAQDAAGKMTQEKARRAAAFYIKTMFGVSEKTIRNMEISLSAESGIYKAVSETDGVRYEACVDAKTGRFRSVSMDREGFAYYQDNTAVKKKQIRKKGTEAWKTAARLLGEDAEITGAKAQYKINEKGQVPHGSVVFLFDLKDGDRLRMPYSIAEDALWAAALERGAAGYEDGNVREGERRIYLELEQ